MKRVIAALCFTVLMISMTTLGSLSVSASQYWTDEGMPVKNHAYTFVFVGDTQTLTEFDVKNGTKNLDTLYSWIADNAKEKKIEFVFGLGDITEHSWASEWTYATSCIFKLNGIVPYSMVRGNHDGSGGYNNAFNTDAYKDKFEEFYGNTLANSYRLLDVANDKYLLITMDFGASDSVLNWANAIIRKHRDRRVIVTTHGYLDNNGVPLNDQTASFGTPMANNGEELWEKCFSKHKNMFLIACGHDSADNVQYTLKKGVYGNTVINILTDPQDWDLGRPSGLILLLNFSSDGKTFSMEYYSTVVGKYKKGNQQTKTIINLANKPVIYDMTTTVATTTTEATEAQTTATEESSGCGAAISATVIGACSIGTALATFAMRKRNDD